MSFALALGSRFAVGLGVTILIVTGCGKPSQEETDMRNGMRPVEGTASIGTQCDYGTMEGPHPFKMGLWDCPIEKPTVVSPPPGLFFKGDCKKREVTIRATDNAFEPSTWLVYPDHTFYATIEPMAIELADDGTGGGRCVTYAKMRVSDGEMRCKSRDDPTRDQIQIEGDILWYLNEAAPPSVNSGTSATRPCKLPAGCYLHTRLKINQC